MLQVPLRLEYVLIHLTCILDKLEELQTLGAEQGVILHINLPLLGSISMSKQ